MAPRQLGTGCYAPARSGRHNTQGSIEVKSEIAAECGQSIAERRAILTAARAAGPHSPTVQLLVDRYSDILAIDESDGRLTFCPSVKPTMTDQELVAAVETAGPHNAPVQALVRSYAAYWAEFDRWENAA